MVHTVLVNTGEERVRGMAELQSGISGTGSNMARERKKFPLGLFVSVAFGRGSHSTAFQRQDESYVAVHFNWLRCTFCDLAIGQIDPRQPLPTVFHGMFLFARNGI
jgi:hypothetical protein